MLAGLWLLLGLAGCSSTESVVFESTEGRLLLQQPTRCYRIAVPPVFLTDEVQRHLSAPEEGIRFTMDRGELRREFLEALRRFNAFTDAIELPPPPDAEPLGQDLVEHYLQAAREREVDFLVLLSIDEMDFGEYEYSSVAFLNGLVWLAIGPPSFFIDDRDYEGHMRLSVLTFDVHRGPSQARGQLGMQTAGYSMSLADRSQGQVLPYLLSVLLPPFLNSGDDEAVSQTLTRQLVDDLILELSRRLKTEESLLLRASDVAVELVEPSANDGMVTEAFEVILTTRRKLSEALVTVRPIGRTQAGTMVARLGHADLNEGLHPDVHRNIDQGRYVYRLKFPVASWTAAELSSLDPTACFVRLIARDDLDARDSHTYRFQVLLPPNIPQ